MRRSCVAHAYPQSAGTSLSLRVMRCRCLRPCRPRRLAPVGDRGSSRTAGWNRGTRLGDGPRPDRRKAPRAHRGLRWRDVPTSRSPGSRPRKSRATRPPELTLPIFDDSRPALRLAVGTLRQEGCGAQRRQARAPSHRQQRPQHECCARVHGGISDGTRTRSRRYHNPTKRVALSAILLCDAVFSVAELLSLRLGIVPALSPPKSLRGPDHRPPGPSPTNVVHTDPFGAVEPHQRRLVASSCAQLDPRI
jgi:hypothetical protein